jgi:hypothetical protein
MARIWQEGFEDGLPYTGYLEGNPNSQQVNEYSIATFPYYAALSEGRNACSKYSLKFDNGSAAGVQLTKTLNTSISEGYFRVHFKYTSVTPYSDSEVIRIRDTSGNILIAIVHSSTQNTFKVKVRKAGSYADAYTFNLSSNTWIKFDIYFKANSSTGAYTVKKDDVVIKEETGINTGSLNLSQVVLGHTLQTSNVYYFDDIALNDTSGSANNSWCGSGTIVSLKPKGEGNKSQWDVCEGYAKGVSGTTTTNIKIVGHGLSTNDVIYNKTRAAYRIITYVDADNFTVSSVTGQTTGDIILLYKNVATITATTGTSADHIVIPGHTLKSGDLYVNTSVSNVIRPVIYVNGSSVYNYYGLANSLPALGTNDYSQASGNSIKTFAFTPYAISNHWEAVSNQTDPSPKYSYIKSTTSGDIDTFDMEELTADKSIPSGASIVAISHNIYAQEAGAGSQIKPVFRIGSTDYEGSTISLGSGTLQYQTIYESSPATSSAWSRSEVDGLEAGVKLV